MCVLGCVLLLVYTQQGCMVQEEKGAVVWFGLHQGGGGKGGRTQMAVRHGTLCTLSIAAQGQDLVCVYQEATTVSCFLMRVDTCSNACFVHRIAILSAYYAVLCHSSERCGFVCAVQHTTAVLQRT